MQGLMMNFPLTLTHILKRAEALFPSREIVTKTADGIHRSTYREMSSRAARLAAALTSIGVRPGDRVATFAWNTNTHLELYFAVPCSGAVLHTLNIRLHPDQLAYIINHAEDKVIFADASLLPVLIRMRDQLQSVEKIVVLDSDSGSADADLGYEELLASARPLASWPYLKEDQAALLCYTSGTTGNPKGVLYSHRALFVHSMGLCLADTLAVSEADTVMPVVPMFHANCWGAPFATTMAGSKLVFTGPFLQPPDLAGLIQEERVTLALGVPTIWAGLLHHLGEKPYDLSSLRMMLVGGAAAPRSMIERFETEFGVPVVHAWGMTETGPLGTVSRLKSTLTSLSESEKFGIRATQGLPVPGIEMRAVDESGKEVPWDGKTFGEVQVRGPWIASGYYRDEGGAQALDGDWFRTGDVATLSSEGYMQIVDRTKDLVKSGGEWISSVYIENALAGHPKVLEACVIAIAHPKWQERPLACIVPKEEYKDSITAGEILEFLKPRMASWWLPDAVEFLEAIPKTSVGKFDKKVLRRRFAHDGKSQEA